MERGEADVDHFLFAKNEALIGWATYTVAYELFYYAVWGLVLSIVPSRLGPPVMALVMPALFFLLPSNYQFAVVLSGLWLTGAALAVSQKEILRRFENLPLWLVWLSCLLVFKWGNDEIIQRSINFWAAPNSLWTIPCGFLFAAITASHLARPGRKLAFDDWLGEISYPLFLFHGPVISRSALATRSVGGGDSQINAAPPGTLGLSISFRCGQAERTSCGWVRCRLDVSLRFRSSREYPRDRQ